MARLLIADVTLLKSADVRAQVRFNGGATHTLHVPLARPSWMERQTPASIVAEIDRLLEDYTAGEIADLLNRSGRRSGEGRPFHTIMVVRICKSCALKSRARSNQPIGTLARHKILFEKNSVARVAKRNSDSAAERLCS